MQQLSGMDHPYWIEDKDFDLEFHVRHIPFPNRATGGSCVFKPRACIDGVFGVDRVEAIHDLDPDNPHIRPTTTPWCGEHEPNPLELLAHASINNALQPFRFAEVVERSVPAMGRLSQGVALRRFTATTPVPRTRFNGTVTAHRVVEGRSFDLKEVRAIKSSVPTATINDVVLTVCGGALR